MKEKSKSVLILHVVEILYSLVVFIWVFAPLALKDKGLMPTLSLPLHSMASTPRAAIFGVFWGIAVYLPIAVAIFKLAAFFLDEVLPAVADPRRPLSAFLSVLESTLVIGAIIAYVFE